MALARLRPNGILLQPCMDRGPESRQSGSGRERACASIVTHPSIYQVLPAEESLCSLCGTPPSSRLPTLPTAPKEPDLEMARFGRIGRLRKLLFDSCEYIRKVQEPTKCLSIRHMSLTTATSMGGPCVMDGGRLVTCGLAPVCHCIGRVHGTGQGPCRPAYDSYTHTVLKILIGMQLSERLVL